MRKILFCLVFSTFFLTSCTLYDSKNYVSENSTDTETLEPSNNTSISNELSDDKDSINDNLSNISKITGKVQLYEGAYFDVKRFGGVQLKNYCEIIISNITETSFDFIVYEVNLNKDERKIIFNKNTANFIKDGTVAAFYGKEYTLNFTFPDNHKSHPVVTDIEVSGFVPLEGKTYVNNGIPGHEFN